MNKNHQNNTEEKKLCSRVRHSLKNNALLYLCIIFFSIMGSRFLGESVENDYHIKPGIDQAEERWGIVEAYAGGAILFGSVGALIFYIAAAIIKQDN